MLDFEFDEEELQFRDIVRDFAQNELKPAGTALDRSFDEELFWDVWKKAAGLGLLGVMVPKQYGGVGASLLSLPLIIEELSAADAGLAGSIALNWGVQCLLLLACNTRQMERYLPMISNTEGVPAAACLTEPCGGSDVESVQRCGPGSIRTVFRRTDDAYVIDGAKCFTTNGGVAGLYLVLASSDPNAGPEASSVFIVPADTPGLSIGRKEEKMGFRSSPTSEVFFDGVKIPRENLIGERGLGVDYVELAMIFSRWAVGLLAVGIARAAFEQALGYAKERVQGGKPIIEHQGIGFKLADMATNIEAGRNLAYRAAWASLQLELEPAERFRTSCMAKQFCSDMAMNVCIEAVQVFGGYGYTREYPVEKYMRDVKVTQIFEGTNEVQRADIIERL